MRLRRLLKPAALWRILRLLVGFIRGVETAAGSERRRSIGLVLERVRKKTDSCVAF